MENDYKNWTQISNLLVLRNALVFLSIIVISNGVPVVIALNWLALYANSLYNHISTNSDCGQHSCALSLDKTYTYIIVCIR